MKALKIILIIIVLFTSLTSFSQSEKKQAIITKALKNETIKNQLEAMVNYSPKFQNFNNIRFYNMNKFKANLMDSLKAFDEKYKLANSKIETQNNEITQLKSKIESINTNLSDVTEEKDNIDVFGIRTTKTAYNTTLWSIIAGLLITTLLFLFKYNSSNKQTKETKTSFNDIEEEFDIHRKKSLEREQVLRRKLQDEINKQRNV